MKQILIILFFVNLNSYASSVSISWGGENVKKQNNIIKSIYDVKNTTQKIKVQDNTKVTNINMLNIFGGCIESNKIEWQCVDSFFVSSTEITNAMYSKFDTNHKKNDNYPVTNVDVSGYINWLSEKTGKNYRLPTSIEWKYMSRAGSDFNISDICNYANISQCTVKSKLKKVGTSGMNDWGLYDLIGNVWEFVDGGKTIIGGSWLSPDNISSDNIKQVFNTKTDDVGFRVVYTK